MATKRRAKRVTPRETRIERDDPRDTPERTAESLTEMTEAAMETVRMLGDSATRGVQRATKPRRRTTSSRGPAPGSKKS